MPNNRSTRRVTNAEKAKHVPRRLWTMDEAAAALSLHRTYLYDLIRAGDLRQVHVGRRSFITNDELDRYIAQLEASAG